MKTPRIIAYLKPTCGWSRGVRDVLEHYHLPYEDRDIINNPAHRAEMELKSGQPLSPCVEVNGFMLADVSGQEVEVYLLAQGLVPDQEPAKPPARCGCSGLDERETAVASVG